MAYDEVLAQRVLDQLGPETVIAKRIFGGLTVMFQGHSVVNVVGEDLMLRIDPEDREQTLAQPGVTPFVSRGKEAPDWVMVAGEVLGENDALAQWLDQSLDVTAALPPK